MKEIALSLNFNVKLEKMVASNNRNALIWEKEAKVESTWRFQRYKSLVGCENATAGWLFNSSDDFNRFSYFESSYAFVVSHGEAQMKQDIQ